MPDPSDPPNPWSIHPTDLASCLAQLDSNTRIGHYRLVDTTAPVAYPSMLDTTRESLW